MTYCPNTLTRDWYLADVCDSIYASLEGAKNWNAYFIENSIERKAYLETFSECQKIVKEHDMKPEAMLKALSDYHDLLPTMPKPPFFSIARWFYKSNAARERAIITAFELVDGISSRLLP